MASTRYLVPLTIQWDSPRPWQYTLCKIEHLLWRWRFTSHMDKGKYNQMEIMQRKGMLRNRKYKYRKLWLLIIIIDYYFHYNIIWKFWGLTAEQSKCVTTNKHLFQIWASCTRHEASSASDLYVRSMQRCDSETRSALCLRGCAHWRV